MFIIWGCRENVTALEHTHAAWVLLEGAEYTANFTSNRLMFYSENIYELLAPTNINRIDLVLIEKNINERKGDQNSAFYCPTKPCETTAADRYFSEIICVAVLLLLLINFVGLIVYRVIKIWT